MSEIKISAEIRETTGGKGILSAMRRENKIPAVIYGAEQKPVAVCISRKELDGILKAGANSLITLEYNGKKENAILKEVQYHVVTDKPIHVDFQRVTANQKIEVVVPVRLEGEAGDVKKFGLLVDHVLRKVTVACLPGNIPHEFVVDMTKVVAHKPVFARDLNLGEGVELREQGDRVIVHLLVPRGEKVEETPAPGTEAKQPEVIAKGKKEEEGAAAKPEGKK